MSLNKFLGEMAEFGGMLIIPIVFWYLGTRADAKEDTKKGKTYKLTAILIALIYLFFVFIN